jgi:hypothetical protein
MASDNGNGSGKRAFDGRQFTDGNGDVWGVKPSTLEPGMVELRVDTEEGPIVLCIPHGDVDQLTFRLTAAAMVAGRRAGLAQAAKPTTDGTCGDTSEPSDASTAHVGQAVS